MEREDEQNPKECSATYNNEKGNDLMYKPTLNLV